MNTEFEYDAGSKLQGARGAVGRNVDCAYADRVGRDSEVGLQTVNAAKVDTYADSLCDIRLKANAVNEAGLQFRLQRVGGEHGAAAGLLKRSVRAVPGSCGTEDKKRPECMITGGQMHHQKSVQLIVLGCKSGPVRGSQTKRQKLRLVEPDVSALFKAEVFGEVLRHADSGNNAGAKVERSGAGTLVDLKPLSAEKFTDIPERIPALLTGGDGIGLRGCRGGT